MGLIVERFIFHQTPSTYKEDDQYITFIDEIPCVTIITPGADLTILYAHGNGADIGASIEWYRFLAASLKVNFFAFEYAGYGLHPSKKCSEVETYRDIEIIYNYLLSLNIPPKKIILWGRSIGSGPTTYLASRVEVGGLILQSPFTTIGSAIISYLIPSNKWIYGKWGCSIYPNLDRIPSVNAPVFLFHGVDDEVIPWNHSMALASRCKYLWKFWLCPGAGHRDINRKKSTEIITQVLLFFNYLGAGTGTGTGTGTDQSSPNF